MGAAECCGMVVEFTTKGRWNMGSSGGDISWRPALGFANEGKAEKRRCMLPCPLNFYLHNLCVKLARITWCALVVGICNLLENGLYARRIAGFSALVGGGFYVESR